MTAHSEGVDRFVMDGFPRNVALAAALDQIADVVLAVQLSMRRDVLIEKCLGRRKCIHCEKTFNIRDVREPATPEGLPEQCMGHLAVRPDDAEADIERRLAAYEAMALPVIRFYQAAPLQSTKGAKAEALATGA
ncbi:hypothetical protein ABPG75_003096 [Micractinium tetrahymenae]